MKKCAAILTMILGCTFVLWGKRPPPKRVLPVTRDGVTYSAMGDVSEEFVVATDEKTKQELWRVRVYKVVVNASWRDGGPFISRLKLSGNALYVKDEAGRCYQVDLRSRTAKWASCTVMKNAKSDGVVGSH